MLANVSGREVPTATIVIAVIYGYKPITHPIASATSPTMPVIIPTNVSAIMNAGLPPPHLIGGTKENNNFQGTRQNCNKASDSVTSVKIMSSSSIYGPRVKAFLNC